jgi:hypothetical protein
MAMKLEYWLAIYFSRQKAHIAACFGGVNS